MTLQRQLGRGVDQNRAVHVEVRLEALAGAFDVVRLELGHVRPEQADRPALVRSRRDLASAGPSGWSGRCAAPAWYRG
jgi:hypothetical protein